MIDGFEFTITLYGFGDNPEDAWDMAVEGFILDPGPVPGPEYRTALPEDDNVTAYMLLDDMLPRDIQ
jgi:hypothetical protein